MAGEWQSQKHLRHRRLCAACADRRRYVLQVHPPAALARWTTDTAPPPVPPVTERRFLARLQRQRRRLQVWAVRLPALHSPERWKDFDLGKFIESGFLKLGFDIVKVFKRTLSRLSSMVMSG